MIKKPKIIINEIGIWDRTLKSDTINWEIIQEAYLTKIHSQKFICLKVDESYKPSNKKGNLFKASAKLDKLLGFQELKIALAHIKIDAIKLTVFINLMSNSENHSKVEKLKMIEQAGLYKK